MWNPIQEGNKIIAKEKAIRAVVKWTKPTASTPPKRTIVTEVGYGTEAQMQADFFQWTINSFPDVFALTLIHIPNEGSQGGLKGIISGSRLKALGLIAGVPDFICISTYPDHPIFIEMKLPGEDLNPAQHKLHIKWKKLGITIHIVDNFDHWSDIITGIVIRFKELHPLGKVI